MLGAIGASKNETQWQVVAKEAPKVLLGTIFLAIAIIGTLSLLKATCLSSLGVGQLAKIPFEASIAMISVGVLGGGILIVYVVLKKTPQIAPKSHSHSTKPNLSTSSPVKKQDEAQRAFLEFQEKVFEDAGDFFKAVRLIVGQKTKVFHLDQNQQWLFLCNREGTQHVKMYDENENCIRPSTPKQPCLKDELERLRGNGWVSLKTSLGVT